MSRIGKLPISIPAKVKVTKADNAVTVVGPKGTLAEMIPAGVTVNVGSDEITVARDNDGRLSRAAHGLTRTLIANMVQGVTEGFERTLLINGVGYRAEPKGDNWILFNLGYSHPILYELPAEVAATIDSKAKEPKVTLSCANKRMLGAVAAEIRALRPPEPYKGKGVRYSDETIRRKEGKAAGK